MGFLAGTDLPTRDVVVLHNALLQCWSGVFLSTVLAIYSLEEHSHYFRFRHIVPSFF
jgi:hypothetical protein